jgi:SAM-dependent methyltransferase
LPAKAELPSFYPDTYSAYNQTGALRWLFDAVYRLDAHRVRRLIGRHGRVLDVGCGDGSALQSLRELGDWELCGVEFDAGAVRKAKARGLDVRPGELSDAGFSNASFDLVRMGHVIEHVLDPVQTVRSVFDHLRPGGYFVGETPNTDCLDFRLFGKYWGALHIPRHLTFFNRASLRSVLEGAGFRDVRLVPRLRTVGWSCGIQNLLADRFGLRIPASGRVSWYLLLIMPFLPVTAMQSIFGTTATIAFYARKP